MSKLAKLYETLTIDERTKLFIEAMARNDEQEIDSFFYITLEKLHGLKPTNP